MGNFFSVPENATRPDLFEGVYFIHEVLRRNFDSVITFGTKAAAGTVEPSWSRAALVEYMNVLRVFLESHHHHEDEIWFPICRQFADAKVTAELDQFSADHKDLHELLKSLEDHLATPEARQRSATKEGMAQVVQVWTATQDLLFPHLRREEEILNREYLAKTIPDKEGLEGFRLIKKKAQEEKDGHLALVMIIFSLTPGQERSEFVSDLPGLVKSVLIPWVWYNSYKAWIPFYKHYTPDTI